MSAPPKYSPAKLAQLFKGATSHQLREEFPKLKQSIWKDGTLWSPSYCVGTAGNVSAETIKTASPHPGMSKTVGVAQPESQSHSPTRYKRVGSRRSNLPKGGKAAA